MHGKHTHARFDDFESKTLKMFERFVLLVLLFFLSKKLSVACPKREYGLFESVMDKDHGQ